MMRLAICCILVLLGFPGTVHASLNSAKQTVTKIEKIGINENTSTEIKQLYDELTDAIKKHETEYAQYQNKLAENARKMKEKEQSTTNKLIGAIGIGAGGIGGQQLMSKMAEQSADEDAERDMRAYMATMHCDYGGGTTVKIGETEISLPGGNDLMPLRTEYVSLAAELKEMKTALEMAPGLESQEIFDSAATQLFDDQPVEQTAGAYASLARAISDQDSEDAAVYKKQTADTKSQLKTAAAIAAVGIVGAAAANISANKDAPKEESAKIKTEHEAEQAKIESKINDTEQRLARAVDANKQKIAEFNKLLAAHKQFLQSATDSECVKKISQEYIEYINSLKPIENDLQTIPELKYDLATQQAAYQQCMDEKRRRDECNANPAKEWNGTACVDKVKNTPAPGTKNGDTNNADDNGASGAGSSAAETNADDAANTNGTQQTPPADDVVEPDRCPAINPRMKSLNEKNRVGDFCKYGNVSQGKVYKRSDGTCSCTALACVSGYHVSGGTCVADVADAQGNCVRRSYPETSENNTTAKCTEFCKAKAKANNCKHVGVIMKHSTKECICNPSNINKSCAKQEYPLPSNGTSCTALCNQKNTALECMPNGKTLKKTKADGSQWCVCNATDDDITLKYYSVCDADKGKTGKKEYCVSDAFNWTNVQLMQATALAQEYARVKHGTEIKCNNEFRQNWNDDYLSCTALNGSAYYEFKFDDLKETIDHDIYANVNKAICNGIYNGKLVVDNTGPNGTFETICYPLAQATCTGNFATTATKLGRKTNWNAFHKGCTLNDIENSGNTSIKKVPDIDSFIFYNGIQIQANSTIEASLREYVRGVMGSQLRTFSCVQNPRQMSKIDGHTVKGTTDDVLRCTINGNQEVDFVFDDMSEWSDTEHEGGMQNIDCKVMGGEYNGRECMYLGETQCKKLQAINVSKCPTCQQIYWDVKDKVCRLPSAEAAKDMENNIEIATLVAAAAGGVIVTVATGGTAAPALAMLAVETVGAGMEIYATAKIHDAGDKFLAESRKCQNASCAEQMLKTNLQRMANLANDLPDAQVNGIDAELARLAGLLESDSDFYKRLIDSGTSTSANQKGFFDADSWEPEQVWRAVGGILQLASIIKSIGGWAAKKLTRTTTALRHGASKAVAHVDDAARTAGHADDAADAARHATGTGPKNTGPTGGASHADDATNTGRHTGGGNTNGHGDTSGGTGRGGNTSDRASNRPGSTTGGGSTSELHPDLQNFNKRKLSLKYHPDKSAKLSPSMQEKSKQIFQKIQNWDTLSPEEQQALSKLMREFDAELPLETLRANVGQVDAVLDNMQQHLNTQRRTATMTETENLIKSLREDVQAARQAGASADEIQQAEDAIRKMEQALDNARNGGTSAGHTATKSGAKMGRNANVVELNENELVRVAGNEGKAINQTYVQASKDARKYMTESIESGKYVRSTDDYIDTMNNMHRISANGADGDLNWYSQAAWT